MECINLCFLVKFFLFSLSVSLMTSRKSGTFMNPPPPSLLSRSFINVVGDKQVQWMSEIRTFEIWTVTFTDFRQQFVSKIWTDKLSEIQVVCYINNIFLYIKQSRLVEASGLQISDVWALGTTLPLSEIRTEMSGNGTQLNCLNSNQFGFQTFIVLFSQVCCKNPQKY